MHAHMLFPCWGRTALFLTTRARRRAANTRAEEMADNDRETRRGRASAWSSSGDLTTFVKCRVNRSWWGCGRTWKRSPARVVLASDCKSSVRKEDWSAATRVKGGWKKGQWRLDGRGTDQTGRVGTRPPARGVGRVLLRMSVRWENNWGQMKKTRIFLNFKENKTVVNAKNY